MMDFQLTTPVVFIIFNRPDFTRKIFVEIRKVRPRQLFVIADGYRENKDGEMEKCAEVRKIIEEVDWNCEVSTNFSDIHLGCGKRISSGLDWVFARVEEAIILEDDCLPDATFFYFCQELLNKYRYDTRVASISGNNFQFGYHQIPCSYYFSRYFHMWGWATWRRVWKQYDFDMSLWPEVRDSQWLFDFFASVEVQEDEEQRKIKVLGGSSAIESWYGKFESTYTRLVDTWDYQFFLCCLLQNGLQAIPNVNLVSNIGFNVEATHTINVNSRLANVPAETMEFPLKHPRFVFCNIRADEYIQWHLFYN
ncbi:MAG: hypothetical protein K0R78_336 [Pelosinus sp.]|jgi:hypothetical protein|nr:hypothetical protein [Pelosinus sp.]